MSNPPRFPFGKPEGAVETGLVGAPRRAFVGFVPLFVAVEASLAVNVVLAQFLAFCVTQFL